MRNFRLGEWPPEAVTPLFASWLLPAVEEGYLDGMHTSVGVRVPFRWALVNGWYYTATPIPSAALLDRVLRQGGRRAIRVLYNALIRVGRDPAAADRAVLSDLARCWREQQAPGYRRLVAAADVEADTASPRRLVALVDRLGREAGVALWYLAIVGGSAWKMEACLTRFTRRHLTRVLPDADGRAQVLLRGLPAPNRPTLGMRYTASTGTTPWPATFPPRQRRTSPRTGTPNSPPTEPTPSSGPPPRSPTGPGYWPGTSGSSRSPSATRYSANSRPRSSPPRGRHFEAAPAASASTSPTPG